MFVSSERRPQPLAQGYALLGNLYANLGPRTWRWMPIAKPCGSIPRNYAWQLQAATALNRRAIWSPPIETIEH